MGDGANGLLETSPSSGPAAWPDRPTYRESEDSLRAVNGLCASNASRTSSA